MYGNMTQVEKKLNHDEMNAYKARDTSYKPLIHGLSSSPAKLNADKVHHTSDVKEQIHQLQSYGLTTDPTLGMNTGGHINAHVSSLNQLGVQTASPHNQSKVLNGYNSHQWIPTASYDNSFKSSIQTTNPLRKSQGAYPNQQEGPPPSSHQRSGTIDYNWLKPIQLGAPTSTSNKTPSTASGEFAGKAQAPTAVYNANQLRFDPNWLGSYNLISGESHNF